MLKIDRSILEAFPVLLPPLPEQRKIASILSSVDEAIESTKAVINQLGVVKKAMMTELLTRGIPGRHTKFKITEIGEVPVEWEVVPLGELLRSPESLCYGVVQPGEHVDGGVPLVRVNNVIEGGVELGDLKRISPDISQTYHRSVLHGGELLVTVVGTIGRCAVAPSETKGMNVARAVAKAELGDRVLPSFMRDVLESDRGQRALLGEARENARKTLNLEQLRDVLLPVPPLQEQKLIEAIVGGFLERERLERTYLTALRLAKSALMSVLLTGEVRVKPDEHTADSGEVFPSLSVEASP